MVMTIGFVHNHTDDRRETVAFEKEVASHDGEKRRVSWSKKRN